MDAAAGVQPIVFMKYGPMKFRRKKTARSIGSINLTSSRTNSHTTPLDLVTDPEREGTKDRVDHENQNNCSQQV